jgi:signal transduction histidine kinase
VQPVENGVVGRAYATGQTQHVPDVRQDPDYVSGSPIIRSELAVPLRRGDQILGVLNIESDSLDGFSEDDVRLAESLAEAVALAMTNASLYGDLQAGRERLQALIRASRDGIVLVAPDGTLLVVNDQALRLVRLEGSGREWEGRQIRAFIDAFEPLAPTAAEIVKGEIERFRSGDVAAGEGEYEAESLAVHWLNLPVAAEGVPVGRLIVLHDVSGERELARAREDLTHMLVHDLRNPLTSIQAGLEYLSGHVDELGEGARKAVGAAGHSLSRLLDLVAAILEVSSLESGSLPLEREPTVLPDLVRSVLDDVRPLVEQSHLRLDATLPDGVPPVSADPRLISRVLENLIGNAVKFTPEGGRIEVSVEPGSGDVAVSVRDTGPGVPADLAGRLFQKFVRGDEQGRGSGLGLAFCRLAVEAHGGQIGVADAPGGGACFRFSLPLECVG